MECFKHKIWRWNQEEFGNIFWRKKRCKARLAGVKRMAASSKRNSLDKLEKKSLIELEEILRQEKVYWKQQTLIQWLKDGERNTKFFYTWAKQRKRQNWIHQLRMNDGS